jgi:hypothetical protein
MHVLHYDTDKQFARRVFDYSRIGNPGTHGRD